MKTPIEHIRLSQQEKDQLIQLKRSTGIMNWNVLCRWALCLSLADPTPLRGKHKIPGDSNVEMTWRVFAGDDLECLLAILHARRNIDKSKLNVPKAFRLHLARGINLLSADKSLFITDIMNLLRNKRRV